MIVGGGLQGGLAALALARLVPAPRIALVEAAERLGGNHTWSFHLADLPPDAGPMIQPLLANQWPGTEVRFPNLVRSFDGGYASLFPDRLDSLIRATLERLAGSDLFTGTNAREIHSDHVLLADGRTLEARFVLDARGPAPTSPDESAGQGPEGMGFQKFLGLELGLQAPHGLERPILMDATVTQTDGYRFVYTLPLAPDRVLVEDTVYSDCPSLDGAAMRRRVLEYAAEQGWRIGHVGRVESGVLPIPWRLKHQPFAGSPLALGYRGGWFHPTTGYSLPAATRLALALAADWSASGQLPGPRLRRWAERHRAQARFCQWLNWMLFRAYSPEDRWRVLERFHRLPARTIRNFYALELTGMDRLRILSGRPPRGFSIARAVSSLVGGLAPGPSSSTRGECDRKRASAVPSRESLS